MRKKKWDTELSQIFLPSAFSPLVLFPSPDLVFNAGVTAGCCRDGLVLFIGGDDDDGFELFSREHRRKPIGVVVCVGVAAAAAAAPHLSESKQSPRQRQAFFDRRRAHPARRGGRRGPRRRLRGHEEGAVSAGIGERRRGLVPTRWSIGKNNRGIFFSPSLSFSHSLPARSAAMRSSPRERSEG